MLLATAAGSLFAFGGAPRWTTLPLAAGVVLLLVLTRPRIAASETRLVDGSLIAVLAATLFQLVPFPTPLRAAISPASVAFDRVARVGAVPTSGSISISPEATTYALLLVALAVAVFWAARDQFARRGLRTTARTLAIIGLVVAPLGLVQHAIEPRLLYGRWQPDATNALPYTPFVNRNDFAAWLAMAIPVTLGYAIARLQSRRSAGEAFNRHAAVDETGLLLIVALIAMTAGLLGASSRSALAGSLAGLIVMAAFARTRTSRRDRLWMVATVAVAFGMAAAFIGTTAIATRFSGVWSEGVAGRVAIWRQTWPVVRDFWPVGCGVGAYQLVMTVYQTSSRLFYISHADNEFLQIVAEGGALVGVPAALAIVGATAAMLRRLFADRTPMYWIRAGAISGIVAVAFQNGWEMTLRVPANGLLFAILAAMAMHDGSNSLAPRAHSPAPRADLRRALP